jgi:TetR/AcrR family transcriptional repressor of nem operon
MGRHKEFNREAVLEKAMLTFWRQGYEGASIRSLIDSMGIHRGSLYDTFGDKRSLFCEALEHYDEKVVSRAIARLEAPDASMDAIAEFFESVATCCANDEERKGCLLVNTAVEMRPDDTDIEQQLGLYFYRIERAILQALERARDRGEIDRDSDLKLTAKYLLSSLEGLRVTAKRNPNLATLQGIVKMTLSSVSDVARPES